MRWKERKRRQGTPSKRSDAENGALSHISVGPGRLAHWPQNICIQPLRGSPRS